MKVPSRKDCVAIHKKSAHDTHDKEDEQNVVKTDNQIVTSNDRVNVVVKKEIKQGLAPNSNEENI